MFLPRYSGDLEAGSLFYGRVGVEGSQGGVRAHLIHEHQPPGIDAADLHAPECPQELVSFCSPCGSFFDHFSAPTETSYRSANRRFAHPHTREGKQELGPLGVGGPRALFEVF